MASVFSKILAGDIPGHIVAENDEFFAILDIFPLAMGHTLVIPKKEVDYIFDLDPALLGRYFQFTQRVAKAVDQVTDSERVGVAVIGLEVPHAHIHLVPINGVEDINFSKAKLEVSKEDLTSMAEKIRAAFI